MQELLLFTFLVRVEVDVTVPDDSGKFSIVLTFSEDNPILASREVVRTLAKRPHDSGVEASCSHIDWKVVRTLAGADASTCSAFCKGSLCPWQLHGNMHGSARSAHDRDVSCIELGKRAMQDLLQEHDGDGRPLMEAYTFLSWFVGEGVFDDDPVADELCHTVWENPLHFFMGGVRYLCCPAFPSAYFALPDVIVRVVACNRQLRRCRGECRRSWCSALARLCTLRCGTHDGVAHMELQQTQRAGCSLQRKDMITKHQCRLHHTQCAGCGVRCRR